MNPLPAPTLALVALTLILPAGLASHCEGAGRAPFDARVANHYIAHDTCAPNCTAMVVLYKEANEVPGLQRKDANRDDTCHGAVSPDTRVLWGS